MEKSNRSRLSWRDIIFVGTVLLVIAIDQLSKLWIVRNIPLNGILWDFGFLRIVHIQNTGAAFGIFRGHTMALIIVDFIGIFVILFLVFFLRRRWPFINRLPVLVGIGLILGGTIGNLIDRLRTGFVTDFIDFRVWPVWNMADTSVTVGTIILAYCLIFILGRSEARK
jgi:signal peptidase II